jgi:RNA polymerase sigma factor (sigma-70 family)
VKNPSQQFDDLYGRYSKLVIAIISRTLRGRPGSQIEDVAQQVWLETWHAVQTNQPVSKGWLAIAARHRALDAADQLGRQPESLDSLAAQEDGDDACHMDRILAENTDTSIDRSLLEHIRAQVEELPALHREVIERHYYGAEPIADIAAEMKIPTGTIKRRLHDARLVLRAALLGGQEA